MKPFRPTIVLETAPVSDRGALLDQLLVVLFEVPLDIHAISCDNLPKEDAHDRAYREDLAA